MRILFLVCTLLSALLLTLPPFLCRQTAGKTDIGQPVVSTQADGTTICKDTSAPPTEPLPKSVLTERVTDVSVTQDTVPETGTCGTEVVSSDKVTQAVSAKKAAATADLGESDGHDSRRILWVTGEQEPYAASFRSFLIGVVMAEMPSYFHEEALRAQAIAARSYLLYREERGYHIYDYGSSSTAHFTEAEGREFFGEHYEDVLDTVTAAVDDTDGQVLYYDGRVCCAAYHAMSYTTTEDAEYVWGGDTPYLTAVPTPEPDTLAGMTTAYTFDEDALCRLLGVDAALPLTLSHTPAGRVQLAVTASGDTFDGEDLRARLRLRSTAITVTQQNEDTVQLCVRGYGHGVGMSQYGADLYADMGWSYREILAHYYPGTVLGLMS